MSDTEFQGGVAPAATTHADFSLLDSILQETKLQPADEGYDVARQGVAAFVAELLKPSRADEKINNAMVDGMIAEIDHKLSRQLDAIMQNWPSMR